MAIEKLQNDFTTPEQSKRLLELGVPRWSANGLQTCRGIKVLEEPEYDNPSPCWSVGRLIRVVNVCCTDDNVKDEIAIEVMYSNKNSAQLIIEMMSEYAYVMDFSKLEE